METIYSFKGWIKDDLRVLQIGSKLMYWPLMEETITLKDRLKMASFVLTSSRLTNGPKVREFEEKWSQWLGVKHSLYVSSGSTANSLLVSSMKEHFGLKDGDKVLVPACTWVTNIAPVIQAGLEPIFCDINLDNYSFDEEELKYIAEQHPDIKAVFITHLIGLSSDVEKVKEIFPNALIMEDVCESHGVEGPNGKRGRDSVGSTFSFYFGHHITTIEGGMVCTNNSDLYQLMRMKRSHGMAREASPELFKKYSLFSFSKRYILFFNCFIFVSISSVFVLFLFLFLLLFFVNNFSNFSISL